jgi:hypothetical protein
MEDDNKAVESKNPEVNALGFAKLQLQSPVPSDIEISQQIVKNVGLLPLADLARQYVCFHCNASVWFIFSHD